MPHDLLAAVNQTTEDDDIDLRIVPGEPPPWIVPWCASCKDGVEAFTYDPTTSSVRMGIQAECHGATEGIWISVEDLFERKRNGKPIVMFRRRAFNRVR
jgi:hypothetical protein